MTDYHQFLITTLDMHTIDLEPYQYSGTNITSIRIVDPQSEIVQQVETFITESESANGEEILEGNLKKNIYIKIYLLGFSSEFLLILFKYFQINDESKNHRFITYRSYGTKNAIKYSSGV